MAVPKKATSVSRKGKRRSGQHHKLYVKFPMVCPNCGDVTLPHHACPSCGTFKGKEYIQMKTKAGNESVENDNT